MAASSAPGTIPAAGPSGPAAHLLAGGRIVVEGDPPSPPPELLPRAVVRLPLGGWSFLSSPAGPWLVVPLDDPVPALVLAVAPERRGRVPSAIEALVPPLRARLERLVLADPWFPLLATSPSLAPVLRPLARAAPTSLPVLLGGESGTGKEELARALHAASGRRGPLVAENCAALPAELLEAELFGVRRGAFTGAHRDRRGRFLAADGGTLLLDEIGELPLSLQAKLLRVLEEGRVRPLGSDRTRPVDVRIVAASRRNLRDMVRSGEFREDLYWRLAGIEAGLPPLRERLGDLPFLATALLARVAAEGLGPGRRLGARALAVLERHPFPGNVRELLQVLRRAAVLSPGPLLDPATVREALGDPPTPPEANLLARHEAHTIRAALAAAGGNKARAARLLGWTRQRLYRRLKALDLPGADPPRPGDASRARAINRSSSRG